MTTRQKTSKRRVEEIMDQFSPYIFFAGMVVTSVFLRNSLGFIGLFLSIVAFTYLMQQNIELSGGTK